MLGDSACASPISTPFLISTLAYSARNRAAQVPEDLCLATAPTCVAAARLWNQLCVPSDAACTTLYYRQLCWPVVEVCFAVARADRCCCVSLDQALCLGLPGSDCRGTFRQTVSLCHDGLHRVRQENGRAQPREWAGAAKGMGGRTRWGRMPRRTISVARSSLKPARRPSAAAADSCTLRARSPPPKHSG